MFVYFFLALMLCAFIVFLIMAGGVRLAVKKRFFGNYYAERGVLSPEDKPNSAEAFNQCIEKGIGIKTEVSLSKDRKLIVGSGKISEEQTIAETDSEVLAEMGYITLTQLFNMVDGKVPIILELVVSDQNEKLCRYTADAIIAYKHKNVGIASFHTGIVAWFKTTEKDIFRGVISAPAKDFRSLSALDKFLVGNMCNNHMCRPQFVLYRNKPESFIVKLVYKIGIIRGVWTVDNQREAKRLEETKDMIVFKNFVPENPHYKDLETMDTVLNTPANTENTQDSEPAEEHDSADVSGDNAVAEPVIEDCADTEDSQPIED